jgi:acetyl-CoA acetyltransferase
MRSRSSLALVFPFAFALACGVSVLVAACKQPPAAVAFDAGPAPVPTDAAPTVLVPLDEDAGSVPDAAPPPVHRGGGSGLTTNQSRAKQCCAALRTQAKTLGASPEANILAGFAAQCDVVAMQIGPTSGGQAPEFAALRQLLKGHNIPGVCGGL